MIDEKGENSRELFLKWLEEPKYKKYYYVYTDLEYIKPTETFSIDANDEVIINFEEEEVIMFYPGESHSPDNLVVYLPSRQVLFGGCMIKDMKAKKLGNTQDANLKQWPVSLQNVIDRFEESGVEYVIPGHGEIGGFQLLNKTLELL